eukprot:scpid84593/ scgid19303/ 
MQVSSLLHSSQSPALDPKRHSALIHPHQYTVCASIHSMCTNTQYVHQYTVCAPIHSMCTNRQVHVYDCIYIHTYTQVLPKTSIHNGRGLETELLLHSLHTITDY